MENLEAFLKIEEAPHIFGVVSQRYLGGEGKPIPWEFRALSHEENRRINETSKVKGGEFDFAAYKEQLTAASVVYPDLANARLQEAHGTQGDEVATLKALLPTLGEYAAAFSFAQRANGLDVDPTAELREAKNGLSRA